MTEIERKREHLEMYMVFTIRLHRLYSQRDAHPESEGKYSDMIYDTLLKMGTIEDAVEKIPNLKEREVLANKYLCGKTVNEISTFMNYSRRQTERYLKSALENITIKAIV